MKSAVAKKFGEARDLFAITDPAKGYIYLNAASTGPMCRPVLEVLHDYYDSAQYLDTDSDTPAFAALERIREKGAGLIGADHDEIGFGFNTGYGLNIAAFGLPLQKGDEVLLSDIEFPSNVYPWLALRERGIGVRFVESVDGFFDVERLVEAIGNRTRVLSLSFVQFFNGYKNDIREIGRICRERGLYFVVDGIQGCGHQRLDVHDCYIDIFASGAQKWLLSPLGTGFFYIRRAIRDRLHIPFAGWLSVDWQMNFSDLFHYDLPFFDSARRFELGTYPYAHVHAMATALELITGLGPENIQDHNQALLDLVIDYIESGHYYRITSSLEKDRRSSILSFTCVDARRIYDELRRRKILTAFREGAIRISPHLYNDREDMKQLIEALDELARSS